MINYQPDYPAMIHEAGLFNAQTDVLKRARFLHLLTIIPAEQWANLLQHITAKELKALLPDIGIIFEFLNNGLLKLARQNSSKLAYRSIFLNALGHEKFNALFPHINDFPNLIFKSDNTFDQSIVLSYAQYVHSAKQLIPMMDILEPEMQIAFIRQLGDRIHSLGDLSDDACHDIEEILAPLGSAFMLWKYYQGNCIKKFTDYLSLQDPDQIIQACINSIAQSPSESPTHMSRWRAIRMLNDMYGPWGLSLEDRQSILLNELDRLEHDDVSASMKMAFCFDVIEHCLPDFKGRPTENIKDKYNEEKTTPVLFSCLSLTQDNIALLKLNNNSNNIKKASTASLKTK